MQERLKDVYDATNVFNCMTDFDGKKLLITEQKDVYEFFNLFSERLGERLKKSGKTDLFHQMFGGICSNEIIGINCPHRSETTEKFLSLNLQLKGKEEMSLSLKAFIENEYLKGENAYYCERCEKKVDAKKRATFKMLPNHLLVVLKRFEYNLETNKKEKINNYYQFPFELDMEQYSKEFNNQTDSKEDIKETTKKLPKTYYQYELKGAILHLGTTESGHYTSLIRDDKGKWYEFNDDKVSEFDINRMGDEAFGGQETAMEDMIMLQENHELFSKIKNAYLLIYERAAFFDIEKLEALIDGKEIVEVNAETKLEEANPSLELLMQIVKESAKDNMAHVIYAVDFAKLICAIVQNCSFDFRNSLKDIDVQKPLAIAGDDSSEICAIESLKFATIFMLTVVLRSRENYGIDLHKTLKSYMKNLSESEMLSKFFIETFCHPEIITEFFSNCPSSFGRFFCYSSLIAAFKKMYSLEKERMVELTSTPEAWYSVQPTGKGNCMLDDSQNVPLLFVLTNNLASALLCSQNVEKAFKDISYTLSVMCRISPEVKKLLIYLKVINAAFDILFGITSESQLKITPITIKKDLAISLSINDEDMEEKKFENKKAKNYRFLVYLLYKLLSDCCFSQSKDDLYELKGDEANCLNYFFDEGNITKLFTLVEGSLAANCMAYVISYVCRDSLLIMQKCVEFLFIAIIKSDVVSLNKYVKALEYIMTVKSELKEQRLSIFTNLFLKVMTNHLSKSYIPSTYMIDLLIKLLLQLPELRDFALDERRPFKFLKNWLNDNNYPEVGYVTCITK